MYILCLYLKKNTNITCLFNICTYIYICSIYIYIYDICSVIIVIIYELLLCCCYVLTINSHYRPGHLCCAVVAAPTLAPGGANVWGILC